MLLFYAYDFHVICLVVGEEGDGDEAGERGLHPSLFRLTVQETPFTASGTDPFERQRHFACPCM